MSSRGSKFAVRHLQLRIARLVASYTFPVTGNRQLSGCNLTRGFGSPEEGWHGVTTENMPTDQAEMSFEISDMPGHFSLPAPALKMGAGPSEAATSTDQCRGTAAPISCGPNSGAIEAGMSLIGKGLQIYLRAPRFGPAGQEPNLAAPRSGSARPSRSRFGTLNVRAGGSSLASSE